MRRAIHIEGSDTTLEISKVVMINSQVRKEFIHFDELLNGTWRVTYSQNTFEDLTRIEAFVFEGLVNGLVSRQSPALVHVVGVDMRWSLRSVGRSESVIKPERRMIHFDKTRRGEWNFVYSGSLIPSPSDLSRITIVRQN